MYNFDEYSILTWQIAEKHTRGRKCCVIAVSCAPGVHTVHGTVTNTDSFKSDTIEFRRDLWHQKTRIPGLSYGVICVILCLAVSVQYGFVTDSRTDGQRDRHKTTAYTARCYVSAVKKLRLLINSELRLYLQYSVTANKVGPTADFIYIIVTRLFSSLLNNCGRFVHSTGSSWFSHIPAGFLDSWSRTFIFFFARILSPCRFGAEILHQGWAI